MLLQDWDFYFILLKIQREESIADMGKHKK